MDLIFYNGKVVTMDDEQTVCQAVAIKGDRVVAVGRDEEILSMKDENTELVDLKGRMMVPGFNDSHMHLLSYGYSLTMADLNGADSVGDVVQRTRDFMEQSSLEEGRWIRGRGWNHDYFNGEKRFPTRYDLDRVSRDHPVCVTRTCGHVLTVNSKALEIMGISKGTPQIPGGQFDLDDDGVPNGIFREDAMRVVYDSIPSPTLDEIKDMIRKASRDLNAMGITSVGTDDFEALPGSDYENVIKAYRDLVQAGENTVRIYEQCLLPKKERLEEFLNKGYRTGVGDESFKIGPLKLLIDGSLGARTAAMVDDYSDEPGNRGIETATQDYLDKLVQMAHDENCQVAIHGIGDKGMYMAFEAIEKALEKKPREDHRHGIVHAQITDLPLLEKFRELDALAYIQPIFLDYDWKIVRDRVGEEREKTSYNWKRMLDMGIHIPCGSDAPVETFDVMKGIYEAVTRKDLQGNPQEGWLPDQAITVQEALYGFTREGAYASFEENDKGMISEGYLADMAVLSDDILAIHPDNIKDVKVDMTVFGGRILSL
ncbi:amidohydrolase [Gudongella sp. SC589]|uniref:amidohydrolase n=1 Tax=Gudongella sp. SC589 TaxID=3385990 RepID=UPI003904865A